MESVFKETEREKKQRRDEKKKKGGINKGRNHDGLSLGDSIKRPSDSEPHHPRRMGVAAPEGARLGKVGEQVAEEPRPNSFSSGHVTRSGVLPPHPTHRSKLALFFFFTSVRVKGGASPAPQQKKQKNHLTASRGVTTGEAASGEEASAEPHSGTARKERRPRADDGTALTAPPPPLY